jgi:hypothetical protein
MAKTKTVAISDFFTAAELSRALDLYEECKREGMRFNQRCADQIIKPVLDRINETTGQENDPSYLAYALEYAIMKSGRS